MNKEQIKKEFREWHRKTDGTIGIDDIADYFLEIMEKREKELVEELLKYKCGKHKKLLSLLTSTNSKE